MTEFFKVSGGGNDFIALPADDRAPAPETIRSWCRRGLSLGADGLFLLRPQSRGAVLMTHFNADGSAAELCLNGTRCAARLAFELGWAHETVAVRTGAGEVQATDAGEAGISLALPPPEEDAKPTILEAAGQVVNGWLLRVGVPHLVLPWPESLENAPVATLGAALVHHPRLGPEGANIDLVHLRSLHHLEIRTFERGVDAETLACGTGVMAAAAAGLVAGCLELPLHAHTRGGFVLRVDGNTDGSYVRRWSLTGDARLVARGELLPGALPEIRDAG